ncbi:hypothetical protein NIIDMKKI_01210 [Mycobacterium kansasii]|uniref:Rv3660c-like CheY-like N-terminal domain-containing protein n=1 Tax=Mycobacterium kansasii TaxID=1768 RepID=A0A7G1I4W9_MYCKA|nr:hypothetical protein NIIDMKKI_01210 [Mycobacterium kansasii]
MMTAGELRDELDRIAAAVGVRVVHSGSVTRKTWSAAAAVVLDQAAAERCGRIALPRRAHVSVLTGSEPVTATWTVAIAVGAERVLRMPDQENELIRELADAAASARDEGIRGKVVAVIGGCGVPGPRCSRSRWPTVLPRHCWWTSIRGEAASICWSAANQHPACAGPTWLYRVAGCIGRPYLRPCRDIGGSACSRAPGAVASWTPHRWKRSSMPAGAAESPWSATCPAG